MPMRRRRPAPIPLILDPLLTLLPAADVLEAGLGFRPTGLSTICFSEVEERAFYNIERDVREGLNRSAGKTGMAEMTEDSYGYTWYSIRRTSDQFEALIDDLYTASSKFADNGFGSQLLCSVTGFRDRHEQHIAAVYIYKRGNFYPFAPQGQGRRNNGLELKFRETLQGKLPIEEDLQRWFPLWDAPGLSS